MRSYTTREHLEEEITRLQDLSRRQQSRMRCLELAIASERRQTCIYKEEAAQLKRHTHRQEDHIQDLDSKLESQKYQVTQHEDAVNTKHIESEELKTALYQCELQSNRAEQDVIRERTTTEHLKQELSRLQDTLDRSQSNYTYLRMAARLSHANNEILNTHHRNEISRLRYIVSSKEGVIERVRRLGYQMELTYRQDIEDLHVELERKEDEVRRLRDDVVACEEIYERVCGFKDEEVEGLQKEISENEGQIEKLVEGQREFYFRHFEEVRGLRDEIERLCEDKGRDGDKGNEGVDENGKKDDTDKDLGVDKETSGLQQAQLSNHKPHNSLLGGGKLRKKASLVLRQMRSSLGGKFK